MVNGITQLDPSKSNLYFFTSPKYHRYKLLLQIATLNSSAVFLTQFMINDTPARRNRIFCVKMAVASLKEQRKFGYAVFFNSNQLYSL